MKLRAIIGLTAVLLAACSGPPESPGSASPSPFPTVPSPSPSTEPQSGVRFLAIGDFGSGDEYQQAVADRMCTHHENEPFGDVVSTGDNIYDTGHPEEFDERFFDPYQCLFDKGVHWHASLGNHDAQTDAGRPVVDEPAFGMPDEYYKFSLGPIRFIVLNTNVLDEAQLGWMLDELQRARSAPWTVVVFHHPVYSVGLHGNTPGYDSLLARPFERLGVDLVLNGHDHHYSRARAGKITYVVTGGGGSVLYDCPAPLPDPIEICIRAFNFVEVEADQDALTVTALSEEGEVLDTIEVQRNL